MGRERFDLVSVRASDLVTLLGGTATPTTYAGFVTLSKKWINRFTMPETDMVLITREDCANPLVVRDRREVQAPLAAVSGDQVLVRPIEQARANPAAPPPAGCKMAELPGDLDD